MQSTATKLKTENLDYKLGNDTFEGFVAYDESKSGKRPSVVVCHAWAGQMDAERDITKKLAELGYLGFAADVYGKGVRGDIQGDNTNLMMPLLQDRTLLKNRLLASVEAASKHAMSESDKVAVIGYCFGGLCVLDLAAPTPRSRRGELPRTFFSTRLENRKTNQTQNFNSTRMG